jgi:hypothetical protein
MSSYFDRVEQGLCDAVARRAHRPWYIRLRRLGRAHPLAVVLAALVVATPAVGAVSGWFSFGKPTIPPPAKPGYMFGLEKPGSSRLLPIRVPDPEGGPPWGLRLVKTSRDDTCVQLGRVEDHELGSIGIDGAWNNDHRFHVISPKDDPIDQCGSTDAAGYGYVNRGILGEEASADVPSKGQRGTACTPPQYATLVGLRHAPRGRVPVPTTSGCGPDTGRVVFLGLLGPDAESLTYRKPGGGLATQRTSGGVGAYLLVFPYNQATCYQYSHSARGAVSCDSISEGGVSPTLPGAITKITYRDGHSCSLIPSAKTEAAYKAFLVRSRAKLGPPPRFRPTFGPPKPGSAFAKWREAYLKLLTAFLATQHLSLTMFRTQFGLGAGCPAVGWVAAKHPKVTKAEIATPIVIREFPAAAYGCPNKLHLPQGCNGIGLPGKSVAVEWSFKARQAVSNSRSWYSWSVMPVSGQTATNCGGSSFSTYTNIKQGQMLRYSQFWPVTCRGKYSIVVTFVASAPPGATDNDNGDGLGPQSRNGSITVGHGSFAIR